MAASALRCAFGSPSAFSIDGVCGGWGVGGVQHPGSSFYLGTGGWRQDSRQEEKTKEGPSPQWKACFWHPHLKGRIDRCVY